MIRDWNLIREILQAIEDDKLELFYKSNSDKQDKIILHLELLAESDLISNLKILNVAVDTPGPNITNQQVLVFSNPSIRMTMQGYDLLETIRNKTIWKTITTKAYDAGVMLTWEFIKQVIPIVYKGLIK